MRVLIAVVFGTLLATTALAQVPQKPNEFFVGVGDAGLLFEFTDVAVSIFTLGNVTYRDEKLGFQLVAGYQRWLNRWASAGVTASWAGSDRTLYVGETALGRVERRLITVVADGRGHWLRRPSVDLYSGIALGYGQLGDDLEDASDDDVDGGAAFHIIPIGVRVGRDVGGFFELGVGMHGFFKAGISRRW